MPQDKRSPIFVKSMRQSERSLSHARAATTTKPPTGIVSKIGQRFFGRSVFSSSAWSALSWAGSGRRGPDNTSAIHSSPLSAADPD
jgi:hypothetical protein